MRIRLGINTGFALNRFTSPEDWIPLIANELGLKTVQFTADLLNPSLPDEIVEEQIGIIKELAGRYGLEIRHTFTSAFTRVNHLAHPTNSIRAYWEHWFCKFADMSARLGAESMGSHFAILTVNDCKDPLKRANRFDQVVASWRRIAKHAASRGLKYLTWEPMSIAREFGETLSETKRIQRAVNDGITIPMRLCLDVDHGDVSSSDPRDIDPYAWLGEFAKETPIVHIKQSLKDKGGHWPFTPDKNRDGKIEAERLISTLEKGGARDVTLLLELSFREREPFESRVIDDIKASVEYWRPFVTI